MGRKAMGQAFAFGVFGGRLAGPVSRFAGGSPRMGVGMGRHRPKHQA